MSEAQSPSTLISTWLAAVTETLIKSAVMLFCKRSSLTFISTYCARVLLLLLCSERVRIRASPVPCASAAPSTRRPLTGWSVRYANVLRDSPGVSGGHGGGGSGEGGGVVGGGPGGGSKGGGAGGNTATALTLMLPGVSPSLVASAVLTLSVSDSVSAVWLYACAREPLRTTVPTADTPVREDETTVVSACAPIDAKSASEIAVALVVDEVTPWTVVATVSVTSPLCRARRLWSAPCSCLRERVHAHVHAPPLLHADAMATLQRLSRAEVSVTSATVATTAFVSVVETWMVAESSLISAASVSYAAWATTGRSRLKLERVTETVVSIALGAKGGG